MRLTLLLLSAVALPTLTYAAEWVDSYNRQDGTYVQGHYRSDNDGKRWNNYSTQGNTNPYTGENGTQPVYKPYGGAWQSNPSKRFVPTKDTVHDPFQIALYGLVEPLILWGSSLPFRMGETLGHSK